MAIIEIGQPSGYQPDIITTDNGIFVILGLRGNRETLEQLAKQIPNIIGISPDHWTPHQLSPTQTIGIMPRRKSP